MNMDDVRVYITKDWMIYAKDIDFSQNFRSCHFKTSISLGMRRDPYVYVCGKCRIQCMLPMEKAVTFTGACANEIIPNG
jgi:hypothetical protein